MDKITIAGDKATLRNIVRMFEDMLSMSEASWTHNPEQNLYVVFDFHPDVAVEKMNSDLRDAIMQELARDED